MRSPILGLIALASASLAAAAANGSTNHVVNAHFGSGLGSWTLAGTTGVTVSYAASIGYGALGALEVVADGAQDTFGHFVATQCVGVKEEATYAFGGWFRYDSGTGTAGRGSVIVSFYSTADCSTARIGPMIGTYGSFVGAPYVDKFQPLTVNTGVLPAGTRAIKVGLNFYTDAPATARAYFDDVFLNGGLSGDADGSGARSVADVFYLVNFLFAGGPPPVGPADVDNSDSVNVADVFYLVNFLFAGGPAPQL